MPPIVDMCWQSILAVFLYNAVPVDVTWKCTFPPNGFLSCGSVGSIVQGLSQTAHVQKNQGWGRLVLGLVLRLTLRPGDKPMTPFLKKRNRVDARSNPLYRKKCMQKH